MDIYRKLEETLVLATSPHSLTIGGAIISSKPGMGKSSLTREVLARRNIPFVQFSGKITTVGVFEFFRDNRTSVILMDDIDETMLDHAVDLVKIFLGRDKDGNALPASYRNNSRNETFTFRGRMLLLTNSPFSAVNEHVSAVLDRMIFLNVDLSFSQLLARIEEIAQSTAYPGVTSDDKQRVLDAIKQHASPMSQGFSLRTWGRCLDAYRNLRDGEWQRWIKESLAEPVNDIDLVVKLTRDHADKTVRQQIDIFKSLAKTTGAAGSSERYFYKIKARARQLGYI